MDLIRAVTDRPYMLNIQGFGLPAPTPIQTPTPTVGAVYDRTILIWADLIRAVSEICAIIIRIGIVGTIVSDLIRALSDLICPVSD